MRSWRGRLQGRVPERWSLVIVTAFFVRARVLDGKYFYRGRSGVTAISKGVPICFSAVKIKRVLQGVYLVRVRNKAACCQILPYIDECE